MSEEACLKVEVAPVCWLAARSVGRKWQIIPMKISFIVYKNLACCLNHPDLFVTLSKCLL